MQCSGCEERAVTLRGNAPCCAQCRRIRIPEVWEGAISEKRRIFRETNSDKSKKGKGKKR